MLFLRRETVFFCLLLELIVMQLGLCGASQMILRCLGVALLVMMVLRGLRLLRVMMLVGGVCVV